MEMNTPSFHSSLSVLTTIIMNPLNSFHRSLLQDDAIATKTIGSPSPSFTSNSPFNSSLALTILVLLTVLFFMAFFSLYIRRFSNSSNFSGEGQRPPRLRTKSNGLDSDDVRKLPVVSYGGESKIWSECSICLSEFEEREFVKVIPYCRHGFHPVCIDTWLSSHVSCPLCRSTEFFLTVDEI